MIASLLSLMLAASPAPTAPATAPRHELHEIQLTPVTASAAGPVGLHVDYDRYQGAVGPGFLLHIENWVPNGHLAVRMVGPKNEIVDVIADKQNMQVQLDGKASALVPYKLQGLYPGAWQVQVGGAAGVHTIAVQVPAVEPPNDAHKTSR